MAAVKQPTILFWDRTSVRFVLAVCLVLVLHLPLVFLRIPDYHGTGSRPSGSRSAVVALPEASKLEGDSSLRDLFQWAEIADCSTNYQQNLKQGYLQFIPAQPPRITPPFPSLALTQISSQPFSVPPSVISRSPLPAEQFVLLQWPDFLPAPPPVSPVAWEQGVFWRNYRRGPLRHQLYTDPKELQELFARLDAKKLTGPTLLEIILQPVLRIPRVLVRQSCGLPELDLLATRILRQKLEKELQARPALKNAPERIACKIQADWRLDRPADSGQSKKNTPKISKP